MIVVGSHALIRAVAPVRRPRDVDILGTRANAFRMMKDALRQGVKEVDETVRGKLILHGEEGGIVECELIEQNCITQMIHDMARHGTIDGLHANKDWLLFLKLSHRYKKDTKHFLKTMQDIHILRAAGAKIPDGAGALFRHREEETYAYGFPSLAVSKDEFFNKEDGFYVYDHDSIHRAVATLGEPAYRSYMADGAEVQTSKEKFFSCPEEVRLAGVLEESYVLALERSIIPFNQFPGGVEKGVRSPKVAFDMALEKVCTSITSGWFREYAWENYYKVQGLYSSDFVGKFLEAKKSGIVEPFQRGAY